MPSEAELVAQFGVSRMTVNRALRELQAEGLIDRVQGVGTFAAQLHKVSSTLTLRDLHDEIAERGHRHEARVVAQEEVPATEGLGGQLGLPLGAPVFHTLIVHLENGVPLQCEDRYVNPACAPGYLAQDFSQTTPTNTRSRPPRCGARSTDQAARPTRTGSPARHRAGTCLVIVRRTTDSAITIARLVHPGMRYGIEGQFTP
jgi:GntR family histidine utilization transcriptional repressor